MEGMVDKKAVILQLKKYEIVQTRRKPKAKKNAGMTTWKYVFLIHSQPFEEMNWFYFNHSYWRYTNLQADRPHKRGKNDLLNLLITLSPRALMLLICKLSKSPIKWSEAVKYHKIWDFYQTSSDARMRCFWYVNIDWRQL